MYFCVVTQTMKVNSVDASLIAWVTYLSWALRLASILRCILFIDIVILLAGLELKKLRYGMPIQITTNYTTFKPCWLMQMKAFAFACSFVIHVNICHIHWFNNHINNIMFLVIIYLCTAYFSTSFFIDLTWTLQILLSKLKFHPHFVLPVWR